MFYPALRGIARIALRWYYRDIIVQGGHHIPPDGPVLVVANHPNALIDALLIGTAFPRRVLLTAKATLFEQPWLARLLASVGVIPLRRAQDEVSGTGLARRGATGNEDAFRRVTEALANRAVVLVFPEGISHDRPSLAPMRSGASRMALRAQAMGVRRLRILPVGLVFQQKERPATDILIRIGTPIDLDAIGESGQITAAELTQKVELALRDVTLNFATEERAARAVRVAGALAALAQQPAGASSRFSSQVEIASRISRAIQGLESASPALIQRIDAFTIRLDSLQEWAATSGVVLDQLRPSVGFRRGTFLVSREGLLLVLGGPVALLGWVVHQPPIRLARLIALHTLRGDSSRDQPAMRTIVLGTIFMIAWYVLQLVGVTLWLGLSAAVAWLGLTFVAGQLEVALAPRLERVLATVRTWSVLRQQPDVRSALLRETDELLAEASALETALTTT